MGILHSGISGGFRKKVGANVGRRVNGQNVVTGLHHPTTALPTAAQCSARDKFSVLNAFLGNILPLLNVGFPKPGKGKQPLNAAYRFNYKTALLLRDGHYEIDYPKIVYSRGNIFGPAGVQVSAVSGIPQSGLDDLTKYSDKGITFSWLPQEQSGFCRFTDLATVLIYNPLRDWKAVAGIRVAERYALTYTKTVPPGFSGDTVHCYISFSSADGKLQGDSKYVGSVVCL